jgi:hypothetical protein
MECKKYHIAVCNVVRERTKYSIISKSYPTTIFSVLIYYRYVNINYLECCRGRDGRALSWVEICLFRHASSLA